MDEVDLQDGEAVVDFHDEAVEVVVEVELGIRKSIVYIFSCNCKKNHYYSPNI
jgi:hypothetical protein